MQSILVPAIRTRSTPFSTKVDAGGAKGYTIYNHMMLATSFREGDEDYWHLKNHVQVWDVSCERQVELKGPDAARLCQLMTPRNLTKIKVGQCVYAPITDRNGKIMNDPIILKLAEDHFWLSIADSDVLLYAKGIAAGMSLDVQLCEPDVSPLAVQGPKADDLMARVFGEIVRDIRFFWFKELNYKGHKLVVARSGWSKQGGFEIYLNAPEIAEELWDELFEKGEDLEVGIGGPNLIERLEGGLYSYGSDFTMENNPLECGLEKYCDLDGGFDFFGKQALLDYRADGIKRLLRGIKFAGETCPDIKKLWPITLNGQKIGTVSSATHSPNLKQNIGFAMIEAGYWDEGTVIQINTPDGIFDGTICNIPFV